VPESRYQEGFNEDLELLMNEGKSKCEEEIKRQTGAIPKVTHLKMIFCFKNDEREARNQKRWESEVMTLEVPDGIDNTPYMVQQENNESK
jgi:hypothetical protein